MNIFCGQIDISMLQHREQHPLQVYELQKSYTIDGSLLFQQKICILQKLIVYLQA
jgi:hypothetical protein